MAQKSIFEALKELDWPRNSPKFAAFFLGYGLFAGTILGSGRDAATLCYYIGAGCVGAFAAGYLLPPEFSFWVKHHQGPVIAQIVNGAFGALICTMVLFLVLRGWA